MAEKLHHYKHVFKNPVSLCNPRSKEAPLPYISATMMFCPNARSQAKMDSCKFELK